MSKRAKPKLQINRLDKVLEELAEFIKSLLPLERLSGRFTHEIVFSNAEDGTIFLNGMEAQRYRECLQQLVEVATFGEQISPKAVERLYQEAILQSLDVSGRRSDQSVEQRLVQAIQNLKTNLRAKPYAFLVYYPIGGLAADGLPVKVGNATFCIFGDEHLAKFKDILTHQKVSNEERQLRLEAIDERMKDIVGKPVCMIEVSAIEADAARSLVLKELRLTLDIINFYSDLLPYSSGHLFIIGEAEKSTMTIPTFTQGDRPTVNVQTMVAGPLRLLSLQKLLDLGARRGLGFTIIADILSKQRNKLEDRLVAAMQWAGRATVDSRREESFLLYAIALESLILVENDKDELVYRLRVRVSHLLEEDVQARRKLSEQVRDLYAIRSQIVHSGKYQVKDADLGLIRFIAKNCILRILIDEPFTSTTSPDDLVAWFDEQILK